MAESAAARRKRIRLNKRAHSQGLTRSGLRFVLGGGPAALAERSQEGIRRQAQRELTAAYAAPRAELTRQEKKLNAVKAKMDRDEQAYQGWLVSRQAEIRQQAEQRDEELRTIAETQAADLAKRMASIRERAGQQQAHFGGTAPGPANYGLTDAVEGGTTQQVANANASMIARQRLGGGVRAASETNNLGYLAGISAKRSADHLEALAEISEGHKKLALQQAADSQKRVAELLANESTTAQARIAAQQFGVKEAQDLAETNARLQTTRRGQDISSADRAANRARQDAKDRRDFEAKYNRTPEQWAKMNAAQKGRLRRRLGLATGGKGGSSGAGLTPKQVQDNRNKLHSAIAWAEGGTTPPAKAGQTVPPKPPAKPGHGQQLSLWLQQFGVPKGYADAAAFYAIYPKGKLPGKRRAALQKASGLGGR